MNSPSKGKTNRVVRLVVGLIAIAIVVVALVFWGNSCSQQTASPQEQALSAEESEQGSSESSTIVLPEI